MKAFDTVLLYVTDTAKTADFFHKLFVAPIVEQSTNFAMLALPGKMLGLWANHDVKPAPTAAGGMELCISVDTDRKSVV